MFLVAPVGSAPSVTPLAGAGDFKSRGVVRPAAVAGNVASSTLAEEVKPTAADDDAREFDYPLRGPAEPWSVARSGASPGLPPVVGQPAAPLPIERSVASRL